MIRGLYISASGMMAEMVRQDVASNNLANLSTSGYKRDISVTSSFKDVLVMRVNDQKKNEFSPVVGKLGTGAVIQESATIHAQGILKESANPYDLAIQGDGFFVVQNERGVFHTRNGNFTVDSSGYLVTSDGSNVLLGQAGPIYVGNPMTFSVDDQGNVEADGVVVGTLRLETVADKTTLKKVGDSLLTGGQGTQGIEGRVKQRFSEGSNVNAIEEMVNMITILRAYEANQKIISGHDQTLAQAIEIGRIR